MLRPGSGARNGCLLGLPWGAPWREDSTGPGWRQVHPEGGHLSCLVLTCTLDSYLPLPTVDLEALEAEFQDDGPASGTVLVEERWWGAGITSRALPCPAQPQYQSLWWLTNSPHLPGDRALDSGPSGAREG